MDGRCRGEDHDREEAPEAAILKGMADLLHRPVRHFYGCELRSRGIRQKPGFRAVDRGDRRALGNVRDQLRGVRPAKLRPGVHGVKVRDPERGGKQ